MTRVYRRHLFHTAPRQQYCSRGAREFFARHGLDWSAFIRDGIDSDRLVETGDAMAMRAVQHAEEEAARGQQ